MLKLNSRLIENHTDSNNELSVKLQSSAERQGLAVWDVRKRKLKSISVPIKHWTTYSKHEL